MLFCIRLANFIQILPTLAFRRRTLTYLLTYLLSYCGNMALYRFFKMAAAAAQYYFRFPTCWCHYIRKIKIYQQTKFRRHISIHGWDYNYFRLWKTSVRHIVILLPVSISVKSPRLACCFAPGCRIPSKRDYLLRKYDAISIFQDGGRGRSILLPVS